MTDRTVTDQEFFWAGEFGDEYTERNAKAAFAANVALFAKILGRAPGVASVLELGANRGNNLRAIRTLLPDVNLAAVEINQKAFAELQSIEGIQARNGSILDYQPTQQFDLVLLKGVLIHLNPDALPKAYEVIWRASHRYICLCEYYNPTPVEVPYHGHSGKLFKRDFAGEILDRYPLRLLDYGFVYRRDVFLQGDMTWFLLERCSVVS